MKPSPEHQARIDEDRAAEEADALAGRIEPVNADRANAAARGDIRNRAAKRRAARDARHKRAGR